MMCKYVCMEGIVSSTLDKVQIEQGYAEFAIPCGTFLPAGGWLCPDGVRVQSAHWVMVDGQLRFRILFAPRRADDVIHRD